MGVSFDKIYYESNTYLEGKEKVTCSGAVPGEEVAMFLSNHRAQPRGE